MSSAADHPGRSAVARVPRCPLPADQYHASWLRYSTFSAPPWRDLKVEIDEDAWATLYCTESVHFDPRSTRSIAVKVINDYGDEVLTTFGTPPQ